MTYPVQVAIPVLLDRLAPYPEEDHKKVPSQDWHLGKDATPQDAFPKQEAAAVHRTLADLAYQATHQAALHKAGAFAIAAEAVATHLTEHRKAY
jgi:hypothetical protein